MIFMKNLIWVVLLLQVITANAQIQIGSSDNPALNRAGKIAPDDLARLKASTTLFTLPYGDYTLQAEYEKAIKKVWTITPFKIIKPDEINQYLGKANVSIFSFGGFMRQQQGATSSQSNMHLLYDLYMTTPKKNGKLVTDYFARISIFPDTKTFITAVKNSNRSNSDFSGRVLNYIYNEAVIHKFNPGFLQGYLKLVNDALLAAEERGLFAEHEDAKALASLKTDTLYVPDYVNIKVNAFTGQEERDDDDGSLQEAYPFPIKVVPAAELSNMIINSTRPIKYLVYTKSSTDKFINVFDSETGVMLYGRYAKLSYNFKNKDLSKLAKSIK
jgi:hypothetical protein